MSLTIYKSFAALIIFVVGLLAVIYPLKVKLSAKQSESLELGEAFASGIFLGTAFFHMLPTATEIFHQLWGNIHYPLAELFCVLGFLLMLCLERISLIKSNKHSTSIPYILTVILIVHSLIEGTALGINTTMAQALMIFVAIIAHKGSDTFALCMTLIRYKWTFLHTLLTVILLALITPLGIAFGTWITYFSEATSGQILSGIFNAFAAGTFIYISTLYHIRFHQRVHAEEAYGFMEFILLIVGIALMGVIVFYV